MAPIKTTVDSGKELELELKLSAMKSGDVAKSMFVEKPNVDKMINNQDLATSQLLESPRVAKS